MDTKEIIDNVVGPIRSRELVCQMLPIMVRWAKTGQTDKTYADMIHALGYKNYSGIFRQLRYVDVVLRAYGKEIHDEIPTLCALCKSERTQLPASDFFRIYPNYKGMTMEEKQVFIEGLNKRAVEYPYWDHILDDLGLVYSTAITEDKLLKISNAESGDSGEGEKREALKEYIAAHPESIGISRVWYVETEHMLPSGDKIDVYITLKDDCRVAVEVMPSTSTADDITRSLFKCVKYKAVSEAARRVTSSDFGVKTLLVCAGSLTARNKQIAEELAMEYIEKFKIK